jgi:hypothetical protein
MGEREGQKYILGRTDSLSSPALWYKEIITPALRIRGCNICEHSLRILLRSRCSIIVI